MNISGVETKHMPLNNGKSYTDAYNTVCGANWRSTEPRQYQDPPKLQTLLCHNCCNSIAQMKDDLFSPKHNVEKLKKRFKETHTYLVYFGFNPMVLLASDRGCS